MTFTFLCSEQMVLKHIIIMMMIIIVIIHEVGKGVIGDLGGVGIKGE